MGPCFAVEHALAIDQSQTIFTARYTLITAENLVVAADALALVPVKAFTIIANRNTVAAIESHSISADGHAGIAFDSLPIVAIGNTATTVVPLMHLTDRLAAITTRLVALLAIWYASIAFGNKAFGAIRDTVAINRLETLITDGHAAALGFGETVWAISDLRRGHH